MNNLKLIRDVLGTEVYADEHGREFIAQPDGSLIAASEPSENFKLTGQTIDELRADNEHRDKLAQAQRQQNEIQGKQAARLTGTIGEAAQKTMLDDPGSNTELFN